MKFYNLGHSSNLEVIGHYPQTKLMDNYNPTLENSHRNVQWDKLSDLNPLYGLEMYESSLPTDIIDRASLAFGLVVSEKLKMVLKSLNLPPHRFYPIRVIHQKKLTNIIGFIMFLTFGTT
jgi:hypothetical protein